MLLDAATVPPMDATVRCLSSSVHAPRFIPLADVRAWEASLRSESCAQPSGAHPHGHVRARGEERRVAAVQQRVVHKVLG
jgi:hypothetical protein